MGTTGVSIEGVDGSQRALSADAEATSRWWLFLITGFLYVLFSLIVLRFDQSSVKAVGIVTGLVFLGLGAGDLLAAFVVPGWRWLNALLGAVFVLGGITALVYPGKTFLALAQIVGFVFVIVGSIRVVEAFLRKGEDEMWWTYLVSGTLMLLLGFWAGGRFFAGRGAYLILVWIGFGALIRGFMQIVLAFQLRSIHKELTG